MKLRRAIIIGVVSLTLGLGTICVACVIYAKDISAYFVKLGDQQGVGNSLKAIANYSWAIFFDPKNDLAYYSRGLQKFFADKPDLNGAIADFDKSLALSPDSTTVLDSRAKAKIEKHDYEGALQDLNASLKSGDDYDFEAHFERGNLLLEKQDWKAAVDDYRKTLKIYPEYRQVYSQLGIAEYFAGYNTAAVEDLHKLIQSKPANGDLVRIMIWMIQAEDPQKRNGANTEMRVYLDDPENQPEPWMLQMGRFIDGETTQDDFLNEIASAPSLKQRAGLAYLLVGIKNFAKGDSTAALKFLELSKSHYTPGPNDSFSLMLDKWQKNFAQHTSPAPATSP